MLLKEEVSALRGAEQRMRRRWIIVAACSILAALLPFSVYLFSDSARAQFAGDVDAVTATVDAVTEIDDCEKSASVRKRIDVTWKSAEGQSNTGSYTTCGTSTQPGDSVELWIGPGGSISTESPSSTRVGISIIAVVMLLMGMLVGSILLLPASRRRRRLLALPNRALSSPAPVIVTRPRRYRLRTMRGFESDIEPTVQSHRGHARVVAVPKNATGQWMLHLAPDTGARRRIGLLVRGDERLWAELRNEPG